MSYTYLLEQGEESSAGCFSDIPQSVLSNLNLTAEKSYFKDNETASCPSSQSGMMSPHLTELRGEEKSMSSVGDSLAKTSQQQAREPGSQENEADSGERCPESLAKYDLNTHSWRTHQCLLFEDLTECLAIFPRWGMMHDGELWELPMSAHLTEENESGYWPTPEASAHKTDVNNLEYLKRRKRIGKQLGICGEIILRNNGGGTANHNWIEWLMGWPIGWTECGVLETDKFHLWLQQHGEYLEENK